MKKLFLITLLALQSCSPSQEVKGAAAAATFGVGIITAPLVIPFQKDDEE